jgi:hypothetical protein
MATLYLRLNLLETFAQVIIIELNTTHKIKLLNPLEQRSTVGDTQQLLHEKPFYSRYALSHSNKSYES